MTRSKSQRMEAEVGRKERQIESLLSAKGSLDRGESKSVHLDKLRSETKLIASLKNKNKLLAKKMKDQEAKLESFKNDSRYTRLAEKEMESQTYYKESVRLRDLLEERAQAQDDVEQAQAHEKELIRDMREKIKFLKEENRELKRDARALVEKTAEWEEENRYLTQELTQAQRKLSVLPRKQRQALDDASSETQELKIAHEKALVELEMQEITHTEEIKDLLAAKRAAEMQLKRQREEFANGGGETGSSQQDYWEKRTEAAKEEFERKLAHETSEMRYQFKEVQAKLQRAEKELVYWRSQGTQPPRSGTDSAAAAAPVAADQGHGPGTSPAKSRKSPSASPSGQRAVPTKSPGDCYVSSPEAADHSLRFSDDDHDDVGAHRRYSFGEEEEEEVPLEQDIYDERQHPPRPASRHGRMDENNDANYDSDDSEHARACAEAAAAAAEAARAAAVAADSDVDEDSEIDEVVDDF